MNSLVAIIKCLGMDEIEAFFIIIKFSIRKNVSIYVPWQYLTHSHSTKPLNKIILTWTPKHS